MKELVLQIEDTDYEILKQQAAAAQMTPEEYEEMNLRNSLHASESQAKNFDQIIEYVVHKNSELYKRLA